MKAPEIAAVLAEIGTAFIGGVVQRVREPMPHHLALTVRAGGHNATLLFSVVAGASRVHLARDLPATPPHSSAFAQRARKLLRPSRIVSLEQLPGERIVRLTVSSHQQQQGPWLVTLVAELFGNGRLLLLDQEQRLLAACGPGGWRDLTPGAPYQPPPAVRSERPPEAPAPGITSRILETRYQLWQQAQTQQRARRGQRQLRQRLTRRIHHMQQDLARLQQWPDWQRQAELLAAHRHLLNPGMTEVKVTDWFTAHCPTVVLALDPAVAPEDHIAARFKRVKKARRGIPVLHQRITGAQQALLELETRPPDEGGIHPGTPPPQVPRRDPALQGVRKFALAPGWEAWVGRGAVANDRLTFRLARGNDWWLHARDRSGAHVVLRGSGDPPAEVVQQAALLAAHFSRLKQEGGGEVALTQRKYLRRPRGGKPGQVLVTQERGLHVNLTTAHLPRVLSTRLP